MYDPASDSAAEDPTSFRDGDKRWTSLLEKRYFGVQRGCCHLTPLPEGSKAEHVFCKHLRGDNMYCATHEGEAVMNKLPYKVPLKVKTKERRLALRSKVESGSPAKKKKPTVSGSNILKETPQTVKQWLNDVIQNQDVLLTRMKHIQKGVEAISENLKSTDSSVRAIERAIANTTGTLIRLLNSDLILDLESIEAMDVKVKEEQIAKK